jgi:hypothetical protein
MVQLFLLTLPLAIILYFIIPRDFPWMSGEWRETNDLLQISFFLFLYSSAFFGGVLQLYNLTDRGLSLRIVIDVDLSTHGATTVEEVMTSYAAGMGITWMYQKRLDDMIRLKLIEVSGERVESTTAGRRIAARFEWLRRFLRVTG